MRNHLLLILATFLFIPIALSQSTAGPFSDVPPKSPFFLPVNFLKEQAFIAGFSDGSFRPNDPIPRAEALAMILKINGICSDHAAVQSQRKKIKKPFRDVKKKDWFFDAVSEAKKRKIATGNGDSRFRPNEPITLAEGLRMLFAASDAETAGTTAALPPGIPGGAWYSDDMAYAVSETILTQQEDGGIFPPENTLTRGQLALLLYRFLKTQDNMSFGYASWYGDGLAKTKIPKNTEYADKYLTAAHKTIPFGTVVRVTNVSNGKSVNVVVNDRGPFVTGRIIDLSKTAFSALESPGIGLALVQIEVLK